jgi:RHS repeat-associated protein
VWTSVYRFTGQEYDAEFELYNYNARLYDPVLGRFITADTIVPDWTNPQSLNRYAYCLNNPLKYVDPSGHEGILTAIIVGAIIGAIMGGYRASMNGGDVIAGIFQGAIVGGLSAALSGALFYGAGEIATGMGPTAQMAVHAAAGAVSGAATAVMTGGDIRNGALIVAFSAGIAQGAGVDSLEGRMALGAGAGGFSAAMAGEDFAQGAFQGAWTSAIAYVFNHLAHKLQKILTHEPLYETEIVKKVGFSKTADGRFDPEGGTYRFGPHRGVDLVAYEGQSVYAAGDGRVVSINAPGFGNMIELYHGGRVVTRYAHLDTCAVDEGARVTAGTIIGYVGRTGNLPSPISQTHLHFEIIHRGAYIDPASIYNWDMQK